MEYRIVTGSGDLHAAAKELAELVNMYLAEGWRPQGGMAVAGGGKQIIQAYQAMVRD